MTKKEIIKNLSKKEIKELIEKHTTYKSILQLIFKNTEYKSDSRDIKLFKETAKDLSISTEKLNYKKRTSPIWKISSDEFENLVNISNSVTQILSYFNMKNHGSNFRTLKERFLREKLDYEDFVNKSKKMSFYNKNARNYSNEEIFKENSKIKRRIIKNRILKDNLLEYRCSICGQKPFWNGNPMTLILDHENGVNNDHRLENLRFVCGNCNIQLPTNAGKNNKNIESKTINKDKIRQREKIIKIKKILHTNIKPNKNIGIDFKNKIKIEKTHFKYCQICNK